MRVVRFKVSIWGDSELEPVSLMELDRRLFYHLEQGESYSRWGRDAKPGDRLEVPTGMWSIVIEAVESPIEID